MTNTGIPDPDDRGAGLRVIHLIPSISREGGGVAEAARLLVASLAERMPGRIEVVANIDAGTARDLPTWPDVPITLSRYWLSSRFRPSPAMVRDLLRKRADVVHVHAIWSFHTLAALAWQARTGGAVVITPHGMLEPWILSRARAIKWVLRRTYLDRLVAKAARLHVLTEKERGDVALAYPRAPVTVIPNFVALPEPGADPGRPAWWQPEMAGRDLYLFLGRLHEKKGCLELIDAWDATCARDSKFRDRSQLVFCGWDDGLAGFAEKVAAVSARHGNLLFAGPTYGEEKARALAASTFFILPSKSEGLPMTVLEAWAAGAVVIMTPECNLPIGFERDAAIRSGTTVAEIEAALARAHAASGDERARLRANGRALVEERYSGEAVTSAMIALYEDAADRRGR